MCGCECCISTKSIHSSLLSWRDRYLKKLKDQSQNAQRRRSWRVWFRGCSMCKQGTNGLVFQWKSTMSSTTSNDVINVKPNCGCSFVMFICNFLIRNIDTWTVITAPQYTFQLWKWMLRLRICAHCSICHIWCCGINMPSMWHHSIFICGIYLMCSLTRPSALSILAFILESFQIPTTSW